MKVDTIIFQYGGVLMDDRDQVFAALNLVLLGNGGSEVSFEYWKRYMTSNPIHFLMDRRPHSNPVWLAVEYKDRLAGGIGDVKPFPRTREALESLRSKKLMIIGSKPEMAMRNELEKTDLTEFFNANNILEIGETVGDTLLSYVRGWYDSDPERTAYVGGTSFDVIGAKKAGVIPIAVATGYHTPRRILREGPERLLRAVEDLPTIIQ